MKCPKCRRKLGDWECLHKHCLICDPPEPEQSASAPVESPSAGSDLVGQQFLHDWSDGENHLLEYVRVKSVEGRRCVVEVMSMLGTVVREKESFVRRLKPFNQNV